MQPCDDKTLRGAIYGRKKTKKTDQGPQPGLFICWGGSSPVRIIIFFVQCKKFYQLRWQETTQRGYTEKDRAQHLERLLYQVECGRDRKKFLRSCTPRDRGIKIVIRFFRGSPREISYLWFVPARDRATSASLIVRYFSRFARLSPTYLYLFFLIKKTPPGNYFSTPKNTT